MKNLTLEVPTFAFVIATRAALAAGIGLLLSDKLSAARRRVVGGTLVAVGAATTVPAVVSVIRGVRRSRRGAIGSAVRRDARLIGATRFPRKGDEDEEEVV
jgi:hypothetical protein